MVQRNLGFEIPTLAMPCGENLGLDLEAFASLKSAGVERLRVTGCCAEEHLVELPDLSTLEAKLMSALDPRYSRIDGGRPRR